VTVLHGGKVEILPVSQIFPAAEASESELFIEFESKICTAKRHLFVSDKT
jgi:hypothetical protein